VSEREFETEPIPGLPERPPVGESILWQGTPDWRRVARDVYHVDKVAMYFAALLCLRAMAERWAGETVAQTARATFDAAVWLVPLGLAAIAILMLLAYLTQRTTVYTVTSQRVVMRFGVALPMTVNLPFRAIGSASLNLRSDGTGDIPLSLLSGNRVAYLMMWPHTRPWRVSKPEPMLRAVRDANNVAEILADALAASVSPAKSLAPRPADGASTQSTIPSVVALAS